MYMHILLTVITNRKLFRNCTLIVCELRPVSSTYVRKLKTSSLQHVASIENNLAEMVTGWMTIYKNS